MKKCYAVLPMAVFLVFLAVMTALLLFGPKRDFSENEKRVLAGTPDLSASAILQGETQKELESFTSDQVPGRDFFVGVHAYWSLATGRNGSEDIYHGKDGYLINAPKAYDETRLTDNLTRFDDFAAQTGLPADLIMVPTTGYLMADKLPAVHGAYHDDAVYQKAAETVKTLNLIDVRDTLKAAAGEGQVCYRTDHHLTSFGNYQLARAYQAAVGGEDFRQDYDDISVYDGFYGTTWSGSGYWLTRPDTVELWDSGAQVTVTLDDGAGQVKTAHSLFFPDHLEDLDKYPVFLDGNHALVTIENPGAPGGSVLVIRDSYAHCFATFLAEKYQKVTLVDLRYFRTPVSDLLAEHPADRLLVLYGVDNLLTDNNSAWLS